MVDSRPTSSLRLNDRLGAPHLIPIGLVKPATFLRSGYWILTVGYRENLTPVGRRALSLVSDRHLHA
jgi:hypothetical protein